MRSVAARARAFHSHIQRKRHVLAQIEGWLTMNTYRIYVPLCPGMVPVLVKSPDSFTARRDFAAQHSGMEVSDVCAVRIWDQAEDCPD
jgi:hypothetical protein